MNIVYVCVHCACKLYYSIKYIPMEKYACNDAINHNKINN